MEDKRTLNSEGVDYRHKHVETGGDNRYNEGEGHEYGETSEDIISTPGKALGKGTGKAMGYAIKNSSAPKSQISYSNVDTHNEQCGGEYDINGRQGIGGRKKLMLINQYNGNKEYGEDSVTVDEKTYKDMRLVKRK